MKRPAGLYNPKRSIAPLNHLTVEELVEMAEKAVYEGHPQHKLRPNDYGLSPSHAPRPGKTLCDGGAEFPKAMAVNLLKGGLIRGIISLRSRGRWPKNVWSVLDGEPFEAQLSDYERGSYHGYPMPLDDDFRNEVLKEWKCRE